MITITVCIGSSCHLKSSYDVVNEFQKLIEDKNLTEKIEVKASFCLGNCVGAVCVKVNDSKVMSVKKGEAENFFNKNVLVLI